MKTNRLCYTERKETSYGFLDVKIKLADECNNGHVVFSVTTSGYDKKNRNTFAGCAQKEILKAFPEFKIFADLHSCNITGISSFLTMNFMYYIKQKDIKALMSYEITKEEAQTLIDLADDDIFVRYFLNTCGYVERQREKAQTALHELERLTGNIFEDTAREKITISITEGERKLIERRIFDENYYTIENKEKRRIERMKARAQGQLQKIEQKITEREEKWKGVIYKDNLDIKRFVLLQGLSIDNVFYYDGAKEFIFNWKSYETKITKADFDVFMKHVNYREFPKDFKFVFKE